MTYTTLWAKLMRFFMSNVKTDIKAAKPTAPFDRKRMDIALASGARLAPKGMSKEQKRAFMSGK